MKKFRELDSRHQVSMFPARLDDYVGKEDEVRFIDALVDEFDLSGIEQKYSYKGRSGYNPAMLIKILLYGKIRGIRSSRKLSQAIKENVRFMFLAQGEKPSYKTISDFRKEHIDNLGELLKQTIRIGVETEVITLNHVVVDGTKIRANAGLKSFKSPEKLKEMQKALEQELSESIREDVQLDENEDAIYGDTDGEGKLKKELLDKKKLVSKIKEALDHSEKQPSNKALSRVSTTDPESRIMKGRQGVHGSYNAQAAVDVDSGMMVGGFVTNAGSDHSQLKPLIEDIEEKTGENPNNLSADAGFRATKGLVELEKRGIDGYIPLQKSNQSIFSREDFEYDRESNEYICPNKRRLILIGNSVIKEEKTYQCKDCSGCDLAKQCLKKEGANRSLRVSYHVATIDRMKNKVATEEGKTMMRIRGHSIESVFGTIKYNRKLDQILLRGIKVASSFWQFELAAYNIMKLVKLRMFAEHASA